MVGVNPMTDNEATSPRKNWNVRTLALVALGIIAGQLILYGPAFLGRKILLPLAILAEQTKYLPTPPGGPEVFSPKPVLLDLLAITEPDRRFAASEIAQGRFPLWNPHQFGGVPFTWPKYSPYFLLSALSKSPYLLPWVQLLAALVAGFGAFVFFSRVLKVKDWPAILAAWCYPVTGWFVLWQGFAAVVPVTWLPWILYCLDRTIRGSRVAPIGLALVTALVMVSGNPDVAGQVMLVAALFAPWCIWDEHRRGFFRFFAGKQALRLGLGLGLGLLMAMPNLLPFNEYAGTSIRLSRRGSGAEERPPLGIEGLPQIVLPDMYGTFAEPGTCPLLSGRQGNQLEGPAQIYTGLLPTLLLAPWAFRDRRRRSVSVFLLVTAGIGVSWMLNIPGMVWLLRRPFLNLMSHNRLVFASSFALLSLAAIGLDNVWAKIRGRRLGWLQLALLSGLLGWCVYRSFVYPEPLATEFETRVKAGQPEMWAPTLAAVETAKVWFKHRYQKAVVFCVLGIAAWIILRARPGVGRFMAPVLGILMIGDLLLFGYGKRLTYGPELYFPEIPALRQLVQSTPGRAFGIDCLPANIGQAVGLRDIRGFDSVDPERWLRLLWIGSKIEGDHNEYAATQRYNPDWKMMPDEIRFPPVLDMISLRYAIFRGSPPPGITARFQSPDYFVLENRHALPRVFVPQHVESVMDSNETLARLASPLFDAKRVAYVESDLVISGPINGQAKIREEVPTRIVVDAQMPKSGLLVLADNWDVGWQAYVNGKSTPILRTNYALRGVILPSGPSRVEFRYESQTLAVGNWLAVSAIAGLLLYGVFTFRRKNASASASVRVDQGAPTPSAHAA
jgi:hypothetical protein